LGYGVQLYGGSDKTVARADMSGIVRCLKGWWHFLEVEEPPVVDEEEEYDYLCDLER
jgi:hypothetical protein